MFFCSEPVAVRNRWFFMDTYDTCVAVARKGKTELLDRKGLENGINDRKGVKKEVPPITKYIDPVCFMTNPSYRVAVEQAIHNPYWQGIRLPFHGLVTWRELADCMKDDEDGSASIYERVAEIVEIAGDKCLHQVRGKW